MTPFAETCVAVLGAGGHTRQAYVQALEDLGATVRPVVRRESQFDLFAPGSDVRLAELSDVPQLADAMRGAGVACYIPPVFNHREVDFAGCVLDAARSAAVERIVYHSVLHPYTPEMPHHLRKAQAEHLFREGSIAWSILQPAMYMQTPLGFFDPETSVLAPGFSIDRYFNPVGLQDLASAAATVIVGDDFAYGSYGLAGAERLSFRDMADVLSDVIGRPVAAGAVPPANAIYRGGARGLDKDGVNELRLMIAY